MGQSITQYEVKASWWQGIGVCDVRLEYLVSLYLVGVSQVTLLQHLVEVTVPPDWPCPVQMHQLQNRT